MQIKKEDLVNTLEMIKGGLSAREYIEQSSCFVFQKGYVTTFNDEVACRMKSPIRVTGAVQANSLLKILEKIPDDILSFQQNKDNELEFRGKRRRFGVTLDAEIFLPIDKVEEPEKWRPLHKDFAEAVNRVQHCVSTDESKFLLCCIHITPDHIEACDNMQLMRFSQKTGLKRSVLVRGNALAHVITLGMTHLSLTKNWLHFKNEAGLVLSCRSYAEDYADLDPLLEMKGHKVALPKGLKDATERASVFGADTSGESIVKVSLAPGKCRVAGDGVAGWFEEFNRLNYKGPKLRFIIRPGLLSYIVDECREALINEDKLKATGSNWEYLTVLGVPEATKSSE